MIMMIMSVKELVMERTKNPSAVLRQVPGIEGSHCLLKGTHATALTMTAARIHSMTAVPTSI